MAVLYQHPNLRAPFPYFGGKSRAAELFWERVGNTANFVDPFMGSNALLLGRPHKPRSEIVNDKDCYLANFWRCFTELKTDSAVWRELAALADWPVNEADLHARHQWLVNNHAFRELMKTDPFYFDVRVAAWWVWGQCAWIGGGWCALEPGVRNAERGKNQRPHVNGNGVHRRRVNLQNGGRGVHRKLIDLRRSGHGIHRKLDLWRPGRKRVVLHRGSRGVLMKVKQQIPTLGGDGSGSGRGVHRFGADCLMEWFETLAQRFRHVRVCCGDWKRVLGPSPTTHIGITAIPLDPPYAGHAGRDPEIYAQEDLAVANEVRVWAIENGNNPKLRIALFGYEGEHKMPRTWECVSWRGNVGYNRSNGNRHRERIWFSPHCLKGS